MKESGGILHPSGSPTLNRVEVVFSSYAGTRPGQAPKLNQQKFGDDLKTTSQKWEQAARRKR
jgi:hypothetical protein